uniref:Uncharacterized protein n=1 Tax=Yersinia pseudotuberculosis serotype O:3 (strain YPIII) TaxID=502800 RepID=A0A0H3B5W2_YERPY
MYLWRLYDLPVLSVADILSITSIHIFCLAAAPFMGAV